MPQYGRRSRKNLSTCHPDLQRVFNEVIKEFDCTIIFGRRSPETQFKLFKKGRAQDASGRWAIVNPSKVVTYKDGYDKLSKHNADPSDAVDVMPWYPDKPHIRWDDLDTVKEFAKIVLRCARDLGIELTWGADWDRDGDITDHRFLDFPHWQRVTN